MHRPFEILDEWIRDGRLRLAGSEPAEETPAAAEVPPVRAEASDDELFRAAMEGVRPIDRSDVPPLRPPPVEISSDTDESQALRILEELCRSGEVGLEYTREYVEHATHPAGRLYIDDLRAGRFAVQAHLDLHGLTLEAARKIVDLFVRESVRAGYSCVRIVHGRGRHSAEGRPLLKENVERWLRHRRLARFVLAFTSARVVDGGGGAVYVLLRVRR